MTTSLNSAVAQRDHGYQSVQILRRSFTFADFPTGALEKVVGGLPANAQIIGGGTVTTTAVTGAATANIGYRDYDGTTTSAAAYASALAIAAAAGLIALDDLALATAALRTVPTQVICTVNAAATAGAFDVIILFVARNPASGAAQ